MTILFKKQIPLYKDYDEINKCKIHSYLQLNTQNLVMGGTKHTKFHHDINYNKDLLNMEPVPTQCTITSKHEQHWDSIQ